MGVGDRKEPNSGLWGKVELEDIPAAANEGPNDPKLVTRKGTLMGFAAPVLEGNDPDDPATRSTAPPAGGPGRSSAAAQPPGARAASMPSLGKTMIGGSFQQLGNSPAPEVPLPLGKSTLFGIPAPVVDAGRLPAPQTGSADVSVQRTLGVSGSPAARTSSKPPAGHLGRFRIKGKIGSGRAGAVFRAERVDATGGQQLLAIKVLREQVYQDEAALKALFREARLSALMDHRNVVRVVDIGYHNRQPYLVMDYVDGLSLGTLFAHPVPVPLAIGLRCIVDALNGLDYAHKLTDANGFPLGLVHCDVSPQNILVGVDGIARVTDFGVARTREEHGDEFMFRGKPEYAAPELLGGEPTVTPESDVFSVGAVLYRLAGGMPLYSGRNEEERRNNALKTAPRSLRELDRKLPLWVDEICTRAIERNPTRRYASCLEMAQALEREAEREDLLADRATVGQWVSRVRRSLNGEEAFDVSDLGAIADVAKARARPSTAPTRLNVPVPVLPEDDAEEAKGLHARIGLGSAALLLVLVAGFWAFFAPQSFKSFVKQDKGVNYLSQSPTRAKPEEEPSPGGPKASTIVVPGAAVPAVQVAATPAVASPATAPALAPVPQPQVASPKPAVVRALAPAASIAVTVSPVPVIKLTPSAIPRAVQVVPTVKPKPASEEPIMTVPTTREP